MTEILSVQFTPLLPPSSGTHALPLTSIALLAPSWSPSEHVRFDRAHREAVYTLLIGHHDTRSPLSLLPTEILLQALLPHVPFGSFAARAAAEPTPSRSPGMRALRACLGGSGFAFGGPPRLPTPPTDDMRTSPEWIAHVGAMASWAVAGNAGVAFEDDDDDADEMDESDGEEDDDEPEDEYSGSYGSASIHQPTHTVTPLPTHQLAPPSMVIAVRAPPLHPPVAAPALAAQSSGSSSGSTEGVPTPMLPNMSPPTRRLAASPSPLWPVDATADERAIERAPVGSSSRIAAMRRARALRRILTRLVRDGASKAGLARGGSASGSPRGASPHAHLSHAPHAVLSPLRFAPGPVAAPPP